MFSIVSTYFLVILFDLGVIDNCSTTEQMTIMNADGIYLAIYSALKFNLKLINVGYYESAEENIPVTEVGNNRIYQLKIISQVIFLDSLSVLIEHNKKNYF